MENFEIQRFFFGIGSSGDFGVKGSMPQRWVEEVIYCYSKDCLHNITLIQHVLMCGQILFMYLKLETRYENDK